MHCDVQSDNDDAVGGKNLLMFCYFFSLLGSSVCLSFCLGEISLGSGEENATDPITKHENHKKSFSTNDNRHIF